MNDLNCLRCGRQMRYIKREKLQLGQTGWVLGDLPNLFAGAMSVDIYTCPGCGKVEFYLAESVEEELPQKQCPNCGKSMILIIPSVRSVNTSIKSSVWR